MKGFSRTGAKECTRRLLLLLLLQEQHISSTDQKAKFAWRSTAHSLS
jgi:hypothetical protein